MKRIIVISEDLAPPWDEGIKKFAYSLGKALEADNELLLVNVDRSGKSNAGARRVPSTKTFMHPTLKKVIRHFAPDVVLYVPSPSATLGSFVRSYALRRHAPRAALAMVALIPRRHGRFLRPVLHGTAPDVVLVPSYASLLHLHELAVKGDIVPVGVDLSVYCPGSGKQRAELRAKYRVRPDAYVYLHVGHLSPKRNLLHLRGLAASRAFNVDGGLASAPKTEVIVIGSTSTPESAALRSELEAGGVRVIREFVAVEEFYRLADCYVFPVEDVEGCVEIPLSVFEALASGLPVLSTPFGGLRDFLFPGDDLRYWETPDELVAAAAAMREGRKPAVRDMSPFSWENVARKILNALDGVNRN